VDFTPHTDSDISHMLDALGLGDISGLFAHLPQNILSKGLLDLPDPMSELEVMSYIESLAARNGASLTCFAGGGTYDHYLPPVVRALASRSEFVTAYTPYQSEVSQGLLQALFEYQSCVAAITGLPVANASLYDGATAIVEAASLAASHTGRRTVWVSRGVNPRSRAVLATLAQPRGLAIIEHPLAEGRTQWNRSAAEMPAALILAQPNYLGVIEDYQVAVSIARETGALTVASVDPMLLGSLRSPGVAGCDIAVADGQPLGSPMSFGGPGLGVFATTSALLRRVPGRLVGRTVDLDGRPAYTLTLRTREQDIRRDRASSNICTNESLNALAALIHLTWLGPSGLADVGHQSAQKAHYLSSLLTQLPGVSIPVSAAFAREFPVSLPVDIAAVVSGMAEYGYLAGISLCDDYPELPPSLLVAVTEKRTRPELDGFARALGRVIADA
jgi:glycine dehydrogenase subunit 1